MESVRTVLSGSHDCETITEMDKAGGALAIPPDNPEKMCDLIMALKEGRIDGERLGSQYLEYARDHHARELWATKYLEAIHKI